MSYLDYDGMGHGSFTHPLTGERWRRRQTRSQRTAIAITIQVDPPL